MSSFEGILRLVKVSRHDGHLLPKNTRSLSLMRMLTT